MYYKLIIAIVLLATTFSFTSFTKERRLMLSGCTQLDTSASLERFIFHYKTSTFDIFVAFKQSL